MLSGGLSLNLLMAEAFPDESECDLYELFLIPCGTFRFAEFLNCRNGSPVPQNLNSACSERVATEKGEKK